MLCTLFKAVLTQRALRLKLLWSCLEDGTKLKIPSEIYLPLLHRVMKVLQLFCDGNVTLLYFLSWRTVDRMPFEFKANFERENRDWVSKTPPQNICIIYVMYQLKFVTSINQSKLYYIKGNRIEYRISSINWRNNYSFLNLKYVVNAI